MRIILASLISIIVLGTPLAAAAQDADRAERMILAERAFQAMQADQMADQMIVLMQGLPQPELEGVGGRERVAYDEVTAEVMRTMMDRMFAGMVEVYAEIYTREELEALAAFYESPLGQSIMTKSRQATPHIIALMNEILPEMMRQMVNGMCDRLDCTPDERRQAMREALGSIGLSES